MATAPGKIILFGEHAVVYGQPAIAVPLLAVQASVEALPAPSGGGFTIRVPDAGESIAVTSVRDPLDTVLYSAVVYPAQIALQALDAPLPDLTLIVHSTIPIASGLGSGAALAAAIIRALYAALGQSIPNDALNPLVFEVEKRHHGTPSGIDNTVIVYARPVYFVRGAPLEQPTIRRAFTLLVADSGLGSPTSVTVGDVRKLYETDPGQFGQIFALIGETVRLARRALEEGHLSLLGTLMNDNHALLRQLTVSSEPLDRLCAAALQAGALGAKLSGGGRGGNVIALVDDSHADHVAHALRSAGARSLIATVVEPTL